MAMTTGYRSLPSVDRVLSDRRVSILVDEFSHDAVLELVREQLAGARAAVADGQGPPDLDQVVLAVEAAAASRWRPWPNPVINATGVLLHTNLGRAPLSYDAIAAADEAAAGYGDLELDLETGKRGSRQAYVAGLLRQVTGAAAALVVNNNAAAVLLGLAAIASGKEVIVSRGEAVEIGGGFRIPDVLRQSGAELVEVGTTNRTYTRDFEAAITERTGAILSVHASNFRVTGFTHSPALSELARLGAERGIPVLHDLGSGCLLDTSAYGMAHEPMPQESVAAEVSLAFFSGDKLLGGPQAGIIVGDADPVGLVSRHPLARAVRIDKMSMAALAATLLHYVKGEAEREVPVWQMIAEPPERLESRVRLWQDLLGPKSRVVPGHSTIGGGSLPGEVLPTSLLSLDATDGAEALAERLRRGRPPVIGRIEDGRILLDPRTVLPGQDDGLLRVVAEAVSDDE